jgi:hypothetical protein
MILGLVVERGCKMAVFTNEEKEFLDDLIAQADEEEDEEE